jgi:hypothetical protein
MPLQKVQIKPGINREMTRYAAEGRWYDCDKVRFRQGTPEKIGGWAQISANTFLGTCRSLHNWITLGNQNLLGVGTNLKFYIGQGGAYYDITPVRATTTPGGITFSASSGSSTITVTSPSHAAEEGDFVTFSNCSGLGGNITAAVLNQEYEIVTVVDANTFTFTARTANTAVDSGAAAVLADGSDTGNGNFTNNTVDTTSGSTTATMNDTSVLVAGCTISGTGIPASATVASITNATTFELSAPATATGTNITATINCCTAAYQINIGPASVVPLVGWGSGPWSSGTWGSSTPITEDLRLWHQANFGEDLLFGYRGGEIYLWDATDGVSTRGTLLSAEVGASNVPTVQNKVLVSENRFVFCFGANPLGSSDIDPLLIRWSDQESAINWTPAATNQAGDLRLSRGSEIVTARQARQEIVVWTDSTVYSLQYLGAPAVWGAQVVGENISIMSQNAVAYANGVSYWMGKDKFYKYDGRSQTLRCDVRRFIFSDFNYEQMPQVFAGTIEQFHEIWWFYCSSSSTTVDRYVVYNYAEDVWYYGTLARTAWLDSGTRQYPLGATYSYNLVNHEEGIDDDETGTPAAISAYITSAQFDLDDGHKFAFVWRVLPDITFDGSTAPSPQATLTLLPLANSGSGYNSPMSEGGSNNGTITRTATVPVEAYTEQLNIRVRGRQLAMKIESNDLGVQWQLGFPRLDMRPDGRR